MSVHPDSGTPKLLFTVEEVADATGLSRSFVYMQIAAGRLQTVRIGRARRITPAAADQFIRDLEETGE